MSVNLKRKTVIFIFVIVFVLLFSYYSKDFLSLDNLKENKNELKEFVNDNFIFSCLLFFLSCVIFINSPLPLAAVIKIIGGFVFGALLGTVINIVATVISCLVGFLVSRHFLKNTFQKKFSSHLETVNKEVEKFGFNYFFSLRLIVVFPYFLINILGGISKISFRKFFYSTLFGVVPASFVYAYNGSQLEKINSLSEVLSFEMVISFLLIAGLAQIPVLIKHLKNRKK